MPFPLSYKNKIEVPFDHKMHTPESLILSVTSALKKVRASNIRVNVNHIAFTGGIFRFVSNWNILAAVAYGEIIIEKREDKLCLFYEIYFTEFFVIISLVTAFFFGPEIWSNYNLTVGIKLFKIVSFWLLFFGINFLITVVRFPQFIKEMTVIK